MNEVKQKMIVERLLSSTDVFARCNAILKPSYFSPEFRSTIKFVSKYYEQYHALPSIEVVNIENEAEYAERTISKKDEYEYTCKEIEHFCQDQGMREAVSFGSTELSKPEPNMGLIAEAVKKALTISLPHDLGINLYDDPEENLRKFQETEVKMPTGISNLDFFLDGGLVRKELTLFSANSGVGKSVIMANLGANYSKAGYDVLYLSLELSQPKIYLRLASIVTGTPAKEWKQHIPEIAHKLKQERKNDAGSYIIKRIPNGSCANDIRSYLKLYELEYGKAPDVLIVDYLDLMYPNEGIKNLSVSEQDKLKAEQLYEILNENDCVGISASQQNREAIRNAAPDQAVIAGGLSKVNAVDNYISLFMNAEMRLMGQMFASMLKTRSSDGVGKVAQLKFNSTNLIISNSDMDGPVITPSPTKGANKNWQKHPDKNKSMADSILAGMSKHDKAVASAEAEELNTPPASLPMQPEFLEFEESETDTYDKTPEDTSDVISALMTMVNKN